MGDKNALTQEELDALIAEIEDDGMPNDFGLVWGTTPNGRPLYTIEQAKKILLEDGWKPPEQTGE